MLASATAAVLAIELGLVFLIFLPRRPRAVAAWAVLLFQLIILLTGNYNFFNLLTMLLCVFLFDDAALRRLVPCHSQGWSPRALRSHSLGSLVERPRDAGDAPEGFSRVSVSMCSRYATVTDLQGLGKPHN